jgi:hypothetical protein
VSPRVVAALAAPILGGLGLFLWSRGKSAGIAVAEEHLRRLHDEAVAASRTPTLDDDRAVQARIAMAEDALAALRAA